MTNNRLAAILPNETGRFHEIVDRREDCMALSPSTTHKEVKEAS